MKQGIITPIAFLLCLPATAQTWTNEKAAITIAAGTTLTVKGAVLTGGTATMANAGTLALSGSWINNATPALFGASQGTVLLSGANQQLGGSAATVFYNLTLGGNGVKTLAQPATVSHTLDLSDRHLDLNARQLTLSNAGPAAIQRTTGFIQSETNPAAGYSYLRRYVGNAPAGTALVFPFGSIVTDTYLPVTAAITAAGAETAGGYVTMATYPTDPAQLPNNRPLPMDISTFTGAPGSENAAFAIDRFWILESGNYATPPQAVIAFTYRDDEWAAGTNTITESSLQAQRYVANAWLLPPAGAVNTTDNRVTTPGVPLSNTIWTLVDNSSPLPVSLIAFTAAPENGQAVACDWKVAGETGGDSYTVERSHDGSLFEEAGVVNGAGNDQYAFTDRQPYAGRSYYRLKLSGADGSRLYSATVPVMLPESTRTQIALWPNPAADVLNILAPGAPAGATLVIHDAVGRAVFSRLLSLLPASGSDVWQVQREGWAAGIYTYEVRGNGQLLSQGKISFQ